MADSLRNLAGRKPNGGRRWRQADVLVSYDPERIYLATLEARPRNKATRPYGDGRAGEKIAQWLKV